MTRTLVLRWEWQRPKTAARRVAAESEASRAAVLEQKRRSAPEAQTRRYWPPTPLFPPGSPTAPTRSLESPMMMMSEPMSAETCATRSTQASVINSGQYLCLLESDDETGLMAVPSLSLLSAFGAAHAGNAMSLLKERAAVRNKCRSNKAGPAK